MFGPLVLLSVQVKMVEMTRRDTALNWSTVAFTVAALPSFLFFPQTQPRQCHAITFLNSFCKRFITYKIIRNWTCANCRSCCGQKRSSLCRGHVQWSHPGVLIGSSIRNISDPYVRRRAGPHYQRFSSSVFRPRKSLKSWALARAGERSAVLMPFATTLKGRTIVHVNLDPLEMAKNAKARL